ncbi:MAG: type II secretion system protein GspG [Sandaracinus sp.]|nr:type II secretion system protein GspG [Myxococcales bacterium]MCB9599395.1 type II secretion system protein GspG [Sandaracinus sp.]MCB9611323.1 type II secretion system protein GspG [Sandaracinus sp.]MCB9633307.1 type II secretion system protein GspG [Sandaracinus sp.]
MVRRKSGAVALPWEKRGTWRQLFGGSRWRIGLAALVLVGIVVGLVRFSERRRAERETRLVVGEVRHAAGLFRAHAGRCPASIDELVHPPRTAPRFLRRAPTDGWGHRLFLRCPGRFDPDSVDVVSAGPSGSFFVDDNVH